MSDVINDRLAQFAKREKNQPPATEQTEGTPTVTPEDKAAAHENPVGFLQRLLADAQRNAPDADSATKVAQEPAAPGTDGKAPHSWTLSDEKRAGHTTITSADQAVGYALRDLAAEERKKDEQAKRKSGLLRKIGA